MHTQATELAKLLVKMSKQYKNVMDEVLAPDLTESQLAVLEWVTEYGKIKPSELLGHLATTPAAVTMLLDRMEKNVLIVRERDQGDRRMVWIKATPLGEQEWQRGVLKRALYWNRILQRISTHNQQLLIMLLSKIANPPQPQEHTVQQQEVTS